MYYVILSQYSENTCIDKSGKKLVCYPMGFPSEACSYKTLEEAKAAHPDKPIIAEEDFKKLLGLFISQIKSYTIPYEESERFKTKFKREKANLFRTQGVFEKPWWKKAFTRSK